MYCVRHVYWEILLDSFALLENSRKSFRESDSNKSRTDKACDIRVDSHADSKGIESSDGTTIQIF